MTSNWPALWAQAPELRPEYTNLAGDTFQMVEYRGGGAWQTKPPLPSFAQLEVAANWPASARDSAVIWLAEHNRHLSKYEGWWSVWHGGAVVFWRGNVHYESADEALFAGCWATAHAESVAPV